MGGNSWFGSGCAGGMGRGWMTRRRSPTTLGPGEPDALGFDQLGLGYPAYLWVAGDQQTGLNNMITRIGLPWQFVRQDGGALKYNATGWGGTLPTVEIENGGVDVRCGFQCNAFAPGPMLKPPSTLPAAYNRIFACSFIAPTSLSTGQVIWPFNWSDGTLNTRWGNYLYQGNPTGHGGYMALNGVEIFNKSNIYPAVNWAGRRFNWVGTWEYNPNNLNFLGEGGFRVSGVTPPLGGYFPTTGRTSETIANGTYTFSRFTHGFEDTPTFGDAASGMQFGGSVGWFAQLPLATNSRPAVINAILDTWEAVYPL